MALTDTSFSPFMPGTSFPIGRHRQAVRRRPRNLETVRHAHHWIDIDAAGRIFAPSMEIRKNVDFAGNTAVDIRCSDAHVRMYYEGIRTYAPDGSVLHDLWIMDSLIKSGYPGLVYGMRDGCDPFHLNSVEVVTSEIAAHIPGVAAGDLLVSIREPSAIAILDPVDGQVKHLCRWAYRSAARATIPAGRLGGRLR